MNKTIGILAHVDAGKTTFAEQLLYETKSIRRRGRVDHKDTFLDNHEIEKKRGITVFSEQATLSYKGSRYYIIDTPGHVDFSPEMERSIQVMDYAIVIISAVEGVEGHTETVWQLQKKYKIPTFFFVNKTDRVGADVSRVIDEIHVNLTPDVCDVSKTFDQGHIKNELVESIAERDDELLEKYMDGIIDNNVWFNGLKKLIKNNKLFPLAYGSALQNEGITTFLNQLDQLTVTDYDESGAFAGCVYKVRHDSHGARVTYIKALTGTLRVRDEICYGQGEDEFCEKVTQIRAYNGNQFEAEDLVTAGQLFAVTGLTEAMAGDGVGTLKDKAKYELVPTLKSTVIFDQIYRTREVLGCFQLLGAEDPSLNVAWDETRQEIHVHVMGMIQLEILEQLVAERFNVVVTFGNPQILYKETIMSTVVGYGHFEPLKHYAEVHLKLEPGHRNSGILVHSECHTDDLAVGYQNLVLKSLQEDEHHGLLTGTPLTDLKITLMKGKAHNKHTSGGDFREATYRALRQGLEKAKNRLLEPYYHFKIKVYIDHMGRVLSDIHTAKGRFDPPETVDDKTVITGVVPVINFINYSTVLASFTQGRGVLQLVVGGYEQCHNEEDVIRLIGYNKMADPDYTSSSVFCSKGQSYSVPWDEVNEHMHCL